MTQLGKFEKYLIEEFFGYCFGGGTTWQSAVEIGTGVRNQLKVYPGVNHAFHNDTGERYNEQQATAAWNDMLAWFKKYV